MKFSIGDFVVDKKDIHAHTSYTVSKVVSLLDNDYLVSDHGVAYDDELHAFDNYINYGKPGSKGWRQSILRYQENELFSFEEAVQELKILESVKDKLNQEFESFRKDIRDKMAQAAILVREAGEFAKNCDKTFFDLKQECMPLFNALEGGGWSHSHMQC